jgi:tRNA dimethylallyltransferase
MAVELALALQARGIAAQIVTADAFQIYRRMDIGTAKPTTAERAGIPHHLIDLVDAGERFTLADWLHAAEATTRRLRADGIVPIVVGGTHLYIKAFLEGLFEGPGQDASLREELAAWSPERLRVELERVDAATAARLHPNDLRRTIRALEVFRLTGSPLSQHQQQWDREGHVRQDCVLVGLDWPAELLNPRINARVKVMLEQGLLEETRALWQTGAFAIPDRGINQAREALGYSQLIEVLERRLSLDEGVERIKIETRRFGKAQRTWIRRLRPTPASVWIDPASQPMETWCDKLLNHLLSHPTV